MAYAMKRQTPIFEQVTPSRSSGKKGKSMGADLLPPPVLKGQNMRALIGLSCKRGACGKGV